MADALPNVHFVGRLGTYKYYNMDQVVGQALALFEKLKARAITARTFRTVVMMPEESPAEPNVEPSASGQMQQEPGEAA